MIRTTGRMHPLRLAIVGCGAISERGYLPALKQVPGVTISFLVDTNVKRAEILAERFRIPHAVADLAEASGEVDAVILAVPPHIRPRLAEQAFTAGYHVLCEKPFANSVADCKTILSAADRAKRVLAVAHTYRYCPNRNYVYDLLQKRALGRIQKIKIEDGSPADWPSLTGYAFLRGMMAGGVLLNVGIHTIDTLFWWVGDPLSFEYADDAIGGMESNVRIRLQFSENIDVSFRLSRTCTLDNRIVIEGERGQVILPLYNSRIVQANLNGNAVKRKLPTKILRFVDLIAEQIRDFSESIVTGRQPRVSGIDGMRVIEFIERCYAAKRMRPLPKVAPIPGLTW